MRIKYRRRLSCAWNCIWFLEYGSIVSVFQQVELYYILEVPSFWSKGRTRTETIELLHNKTTLLTTFIYIYIYIRFVGSDLGPNCLQRLLAEDTCRQKVNLFQAPKLQYAWFCILYCSLNCIDTIYRNQVNIKRFKTICFSVNYLAFSKETSLGWMLSKVVAGCLTLLNYDNVRN